MSHRYIPCETFRSITRFGVIHGSLSGSCFAQFIFQQMNLSSQGFDRAVALGFSFDRMFVFLEIEFVRCLLDSVLCFVAAHRPLDLRFLVEAYSIFSHFDLEMEESHREYEDVEVLLELVPNFSRTSAVSLVIC